MHKNTYSTGQFAKLANVTERTIRYYDRIGLLKPSFVMENGYRKYTKSDLLKLHKIISLKQLGFSLEEIYPMVIKDQNLIDSFSLQIDLLGKQIQQLQSVREAMQSLVQNAQEDSFSWNQFLSLMKMANSEVNIVEHYKNSNNLNVRITLHEKYSQNTKGWFSWLFEQIDFSNINRLLEIGCGNGKLWENHRTDLRNREVFLSDVSEGMIDEVRKKLGKEFNCIVADCMAIPFKNNYFDAVIANHVLFYVQDLDKGLQEIQRILNKKGILYASTYGKNHMKEINDIAQSYDSRINLSDNKLYDLFGLDNGEFILKKYFSKVEKILYNDFLEVDDAQPIVDYIMSCHGNQNEIIGSKLIDFTNHVENVIKKNKVLKITKQAGIFKCYK